MWNYRLYLQLILNSHNESMHDMNLLLTLLQNEEQFCLFICHEGDILSKIAKNYRLYLSAAEWKLSLLLTNGCSEFITCSSEWQDL